MKKVKVFDLSISGDYQCTYVYMNGIRVYESKDTRDCYMFIAELKARIIMAGGIIKGENNQ